MGLGSYLGATPAAVRAGFQDSRAGAEFRKWIEEHRNQYTLKDVRSYPATRGSAVEPSIFYVVCEFIPTEAAIAAVYTLEAAVTAAERRLTAELSGVGSRETLVGSIQAEPLVGIVRSEIAITLAELFSNAGV